MTSQTLFEQVALQWHHERYVLLRRAQPGRCDQVLAWLTNHIVPFMTAHAAASGADLTRDQFMGFQDWVGNPDRVDLGPAPANPDQTVTVAQAVTVTGAAPSTIKRRLKDGKFPNAVQAADRSWAIPMGDLHAAGLLNGTRLRRGPSALPTNHQQQAEMRKALQDVLLYGQEMGRWTLSFNPEAVLLKRNHTPAAQRRQLTLGEAAQVAGHLHVVHQFALWLMRVLGLRKAEAYGLQVRDVTWVEGRMFLFVRRQGGRPLKQDAPDGSIITAPFKNRLKTEQSMRMLLVPRPLERLITVVIDVFHTEDGLVQERNRLIPGLRETDIGGGNAFGTALRRAANACAINVSLDPDEFLAMMPKDLRADLITDLASEDVPESVRKRYAGHIAGDDVHDRRYVRPTATQVRKQLAASDALEALIGEELPDGLMVPTAVSCTTANQPELRRRKQQVDAALLSVGWLRNHIDAEGRPMLTSDQVAAMFGVSLHKVHEWARGAHAPAVFDGQRHLFDMAAMVALARDLAGYVSVRNLADELDVDPHLLRYRMRQEGIEPSKALPGMLQMLTAADVTHLRRMFDQERQIRDRAATFEECAKTLGVGAGLIPPLVENGLLTLDPQAGERSLVTRTSLAALAARSLLGGRGRAS